MWETTAQQRCELSASVGTPTAVVTGAGFCVTRRHSLLTPSIHSMYVHQALQGRSAKVCDGNPALVADGSGRARRGGHRPRV